MANPMCWAAIGEIQVDLLCLAGASCHAGYHEGGLQALAQQFRGQHYLVKVDLGQRLMCKAVLLESGGNVGELGVSIQANAKMVELSLLMHAGYFVTLGTLQCS